MGSPSLNKMKLQCMALAHASSHMLSAVKETFSQTRQVILFL